jgi:hypothetical protein
MHVLLLYTVVTVFTFILAWPDLRPLLMAPLTTAPDTPNFAAITFWDVPELCMAQMALVCSLIGWRLLSVILRLPQLVKFFSDLSVIEHQRINAIAHSSVVIALAINLALHNRNQLSGLCQIIEQLVDALVTH